MKSRCCCIHDSSIYTLEALDLVFEVVCESTSGLKHSRKVELNVVVTVFVQCKIEIAHDVWKAK